ncbi:SMI1/KNR4 family protein [Streptomyces sp. NPDC058195]|uniref:SMI1/KNR4 family protein n=1 Tax=Streptomyces sp. NPDC058195 TaxID=3346375 RepID=UPI0036EC2B9E
MTDTTPFDWRPFLLRWSEEWSDSLPADEARHEDNEAARRERWLGFPPASAERIVAMEKRLGLRMPPSYREFLEVSDGWRHAGGFVSLLAGSAEARWHDNASGLADMFEEYLDEDAGPEEWREADLWRRGLQLDVESDALYVVLDPGDVAEDGEWAVYTWAGWRAAPPHRYASFAAFMRAMHREFHRLRTHPADGAPEFVNDTTRELDALVGRARLTALRGGWERAAEALDEAKEYGRPRAAGLGDQIRLLLGRTSAVRLEGVVTDPRYAPDLLPALVSGHATASYGDGSALMFSLRGADDGVVSSARAMLERMRDGTYRYEAAGPFGEAVERARERARWGDGDGAWRTLMDALPEWLPLGPDHLAPLGWVADPLLGPLLTPERGRELLSTPRGGQRGEPPVRSAALDPDGLAWLADPESRDGRRSYRFVLVEDVEPKDLPERLADRNGDGDGSGSGSGSGSGVVLDDPMTCDEALRHSLQGRREFSSYDDKALVAVGRAGARWSFAFDGNPARFDPLRFVSPAATAGTGTRAVVVWGGLRTRHGEPFFHLSVARDGAQEYAFTYADGEIRRTGEIPPALDPDRFFGSRRTTGTAEEDEAGGGGAEERLLLEAVSGTFGAGLPRHALTRGRLHTFTTRSWTRPPGDGETYAVISLGRDAAS